MKYEVRENGHDGMMVWTGEANSPEDAIEQAYDGITDNDCGDLSASDLKATAVAIEKGELCTSGWLHVSGLTPNNLNEEKAQTMKDTNLEQAIKALYRCVQIAQTAQRHCNTQLVEKVEYHRMQICAEKAARALRLYTFTARDAERIAATVKKCPECGQEVNDV